ncbi:trichohyalin-like [Cimex lectularius]|uniref:Trichohyalin-plectin-homology domain-containing protein n=1 Tax=Cimex lectularius TaxID=79782 RepID=A0A8I6RZW4_CIMLE|nr:trichohyalin-like [Cimex lectularius]
MKRLVVQNKETGRRSKVVVFDHCQWEKIQNRVSKTVDQAIETAVAALEKEERRQKSKEMAATWENTFVNLRKRRFQERQQRLDKEMAEIQVKYDAMKKEQEEIKMEIKRKAKEILFEQRDSTKLLRSAQKLSAVYHERAAQIEFARKLKEEQKAEEAEEVRRIYEDVALYHKEEEEKKKKELEEKQKKKEDYIALLKQMELEKKKEKEYLLNGGMDELKLMKEELEQIRKNEKEELERKKKLCLQYMEDGINYYRKYHAAMLADDKEEDMAIAIIAKGKADIGEKRRLKEEESVRQNIERQQRVANNLAVLISKKQTDEEECYQRAVAEKDALWEKAEADRIAKAQKLRKERIEAHLAYLKENSANKEQEHELFKWAVLQRLANTEQTKTCEDELKRKKLKRILVCQDANRNLIKELNKKIAREKQEDINSVKRAIDLWLLEDKEFLEFAEKIKEECKARGQNTYPIDVAILHYKTSNGLVYQKRGVGLVEVTPTFPLDYKVDRAPPRSKLTQEFINESKRRAEIKERRRNLDPTLRLIENKLNECLCVKTGCNGLDVDAKQK